MHHSSVAVARTGRRFGLAMLAAVALAFTACSSSGAAPTSDPNAQGSAMVNEFFSILQQPDAAKADRLKTFLAPEFQVVRDTGDQLTKDAYLAKNPTVTTFSITNVVGTQAGDVLVASYRITTTETIDGVPQTTTAPRLSVFRWIDGAWHLAAHSNFGALPQ